MSSRTLAVGLALLSLLLTTGAGLAVPVPDGFYAVVRREKGPADRAALGENELRLRFHAAFRDPGEDAEETAVVQREPFVPLLLKEAPAKTPDLTERTQFWVGVSLTEEAAAQFEEFTRQHLGEPVAIVVGGEVVTIHGIREVIKGGKVQISRCGDDGCQILFRELQENVPTE